MEDSTYMIIWGSVILALLVFYIIALVKSKRGEMVFTANNWDMALLLGCPILFFVGWCGGLEPPYMTYQYIVWTLSGLCLVGTLIFAVVSNLGNLWHIICAILAKIFVVWLTLFAIFLLICALVISVLWTLFTRNDDDDGEVIVLKYDKFLRAYVGYRA
jgi:hypothetical protein